jgi:hypothetical protein
MEIVAGIAAIMAVLFINLYWKSVRQCNQLTNFALLILLDDGVHTAQRKGLTELVRSIDAKNAVDLGSKINLATGRLAAKLEGTTLGVAGLLWKLKTGG